MSDTDIIVTNIYTVEIGLYKHNIIVLNDKIVLIRIKYKDTINVLNNIEKYSNAYTLHINENNIIYLPNKIKYFNNLQHLYLNYNKLYKMPNIRNLINLRDLDISNNNFKIIPKSIKYLINLNCFYLNDNKIKVIPEEIFLNLKKLQIFIFNNNYIKFISNNISNLTNLVFLGMGNNQITTIPNSIIYCRNLNQFNYQNNQIENISPIVTRFLNRMHNLDEIQVYNDMQNIHDHSIQETLFNSIVNIINQNYIINKTDIFNDIIKDTILTEKTKQLLLDYCENNQVHSKTQLTFEELLCNVWILINSLDTKNEIKSILNTEINDSFCMCFTGRISRLVNSLNGFTDLVKINISDNQQISNIIILIKEKLKSENNYTLEKHKELAIKELKAYNYSDDIINEWISYII
jgi:hypothetical protein